ncbi:MAG: hypothetical protein JNK26_04190, partial [Candidatus Doudnabacteria bacterium]|nr:hypothetical protein [Candidatus Doudnabacteria bacterium]
MKNLQLFVPIILLFVVAAAFSAIDSTTTQFFFKLGKLASFIAILSLYIALCLRAVSYLAGQAGLKMSIPKFLISFLWLNTTLFALVHAFISFVVLLRGFVGLEFLGNRYVTPILLGLISLCFFLVTAFANLLKTRLSQPIRKWIQPMVYGTCGLIVLHALMLGSTFRNMEAFVPRLTLILATALLAAWTMCGFVWLSLKLNRKVSWNLYGVLLGLLSLMIGGYLVLGRGVENRFSIHAQQGATHSGATVGGHEMSPRFSMNLSYQPLASLDQPLDIEISLFDSEANKLVTDFSLAESVPMHFILVDIGISDFRHLHPTEVEPGKFKVTLTALEAKTYISYISFQPLGFAEESRIFNIYPVSRDLDYAAAPDKTLSASGEVNVGEYVVSLQSGLEFVADDFATEARPLTFQVSTQASNEAVELEKYLNNFGHLTMINLSNYSYVHVHPRALANQEKADEVSFSRPENMGVPAGVYRVFVEFKHHGLV